MSQLRETISFDVNVNMLQKSEFQEFVKKLEHSQQVIIIMNETHGMVIINGKKTDVATSRMQIEIEIRKLSPEPGPPSPKIILTNQMLQDTIELSVAKNNFLTNFGKKTLTTIRDQAGINSANVINDKLELLGTNTAIKKIKSYLQDTLYEKNLSITSNMKRHLELTCKGRILREFSRKYRVGTSLQQFRPYDRYNGIDTWKRDLPNTRGGNHATRSRHSPTSYSANASKMNGSGPERDNRIEQSNPKMGEYKDAANQESDDDDNNSQVSDSDKSMLSNFTTDSFNIKNFNDPPQEPVIVSLCSDSEASLSEAMSELQSYSFNIESWILSDEELTFILEQQQQRDKPPQNNMSTRDRSVQIKFYFRNLIQNLYVHIYLYYTRGMWHVNVSGFKSGVQSAMLKIRGHLNDVVDTEVQIPISAVMAFFLRRKASSDINRLKNLHNIKIIIFSPRRDDHNTSEVENDNHCVKLIGPVSRINLAQTKIENFLKNLSEQQQDFPCDTWDISKDISTNIITRLKKIHDSDDYEAVGVVKLYNLAIERRQTTPKVTITVVGLNKEIAEDVIEQCKHITEGYVVWKPSLNVYRALHTILLVERRPSIVQFQQEWNTSIQLQNETNTIIISARSKIIAKEIEETLQNLATGKSNRIADISITIPIQFNIRRFIDPAIQPVLDEVKTQRVYINSKGWNELILRGRAEIVNSAQEKINTIIDDIKQKIVTSHLTLPSIESEFIRADSYRILTRIEHETNTIIRDVRVDAKGSKLSDKFHTNSVITCIENNRGQTILVKKGDITKTNGVDAIINAANGPLDHTGGLDKIISDAAGPVLYQECTELIVKNGGVAIPTGTAVKTTAGHLPYKSIIHAIGPQYFGGNEQERPLLFFSILSSLRIAEQEGYNSIALPAISAVTYGFPLQDCTNIVFRAVKQFFADFPQSHVRKVILLDNDDAVCNSFACELGKDHISAAADNNDDITKYNLHPLKVTWRWQDNDEEKNYDDTNTRLIEDAFQHYIQTAIRSTLIITPDNLKSATTVRYSICFHRNFKQRLAITPNALNTRFICGYQMKESNDTKRNIIRYPVVSSVHNTFAEYRPKPLDTYHLKIQYNEDDWSITGIDRVAVKQAETEIRKAIVSAIISEPFSVNLNEDIDSHKTAITNIAIEQFIQVDFQQDFIGNLSLILKGFPKNILQAKLQISLYAQDILRMIADKDNQLHTSSAHPTDWLIHF